MNNTMIGCTPTLKQVDAEKALRKQGFRFANWIRCNADYNGEMPKGYDATNTLRGAMIMVKSVERWQREYREIELDGSVN